MALSLIYAKIEDDLYLNWEIILSPIFLFCIINIFKQMIRLIYIDFEKNNQNIEIFFTQIIFSTLINLNLIGILIFFI